MNNKGYTLTELLMTITILAVLTTMSFIGIVAPKKLLERETTLASLELIIEKIRMNNLITGQGTQISWTPWVMRLNEQKILEFPQNGPWRWTGKVSRLSIGADQGMKVISQTGEEISTPQSLNLTYNGKVEAFLEIDPGNALFRLLKPGEARRDTCKN